MNGKGKQPKMPPHPKGAVIVIGLIPNELGKKGIKPHEPVVKINKKK